MEKKEANGLPSEGLKSGKGKYLKETKLIKRPFSSIKVIPHVQESEEILNAENPTLEELTKNRMTIHKLQVEKTAIKNEFAEKSIEEKEIDISKYREKMIQKGKTYLEYREVKMSQFKKSASPAQAQPCRIRSILIEECLQKVCVNINETVPIWGNWEWEAGEDIHVTEGELPKFSLTDCVTAGNGYTYSEGWLRVSGSVQINEPTVIKGIGVYNSARVCGYDADGEDHIYGDDWGRVRIYTRLKVRSIIPGGAMSYLYNRKIREVNSKNSSGNTAWHPWMPDNRNVDMNYSVNTGHIFTIDYTISYIVDRSNDYDAAACFYFDNLVIRPYIIYQSCHNEWTRVRDDIIILGQMEQAPLVLHVIDEDDK